MKRGHLVLNLVAEEEICIGDDITVKLVRVKGHQAILMVTAPRVVPVDRRKVYESKKQDRENAKNVG